MSQYQSIVEGATAYKEQSLQDVNGLRYMDHIRDAVADEDELSVVLRTDDAVFDDVGVRAWWSHGRYDWNKADDPEYSKLVFEVPDEVTRRLQSQHAQQVMSRFFGKDAEVQLELPILGKDSDATRNGFEIWDADRTAHETIVDDWQTLKSAIALTDQSYRGHLGGQTLELLSAAGTSFGQARIRQAKLELYIPPTAVTSIQQLWSTAFRREVLLGN